MEKQNNTITPPRWEDLFSVKEIDGKQYVVLNPKYAALLVPDLVLTGPSNELEG